MKIIKFIIVLVLILALNSFFKTIINTDTTDFQFIYTSKIVLKIFLSLITIFFIIKWGLIKGRKIFKNNKIVIPLLLILIFISVKLVISNSTEQNVLLLPINHFLFFSSCLSVGMFEEFFFRILVFYFLSTVCFSEKNNLIKSILISSLLFGLMHFTNFFSPDYDKLSVINQMFLAFSLGILLQSLFIKFKNIYLIIIIHALINYLGSYKSRLFDITREVVDSTNTVNDLIQTLIIIFVITVLFILPFSYYMIKPEIKTWNNNL
jgi:membrane protease YdiL (CAAX protease family)